MTRLNTWNLILLFIVSLVHQSTAQTKYYWSDDQKNYVQEDFSSVMVHFSEETSVTTQATRISNDPAIESIEIHESKNSMIVFLKADQNRSAKDWEDYFKTNKKYIRSISPAWTLDDGFPLWNTHKVVLKLKRGYSINLLEQYLQKYQAWVREEQYGNILVETDQIDQIFHLANEIKESGLVEFAHPDFYAVLTKFSDPLYPFQFQMNNTGQTIDGHTGQVDCDVDAPEAWAITTGSSNITISVIDDGLESHEDFNDANGNSRLLPGYTPSNNGNGTPTSSGRHGVACAGIITASHNNLGIKGLAPESKFFSVNIFYGGESTSDLASAFNWSVLNGADVISNSWGYSSCSLNLSVLTNAINNAANNGRNGLGCVIVFASGNNNFNCVTYPGNLDSVIGVGAVTNTGVRSYYSNYGSDLDVVAPSNGAAGVRTTDRMGSPGYTNGNYTNSFGGTSAACPAVAGVAALALAANPSLTSSVVRDIINETADDMGATGFDLFYGNGRANAHQAVLCAQAGGNCTGGGGGGGGGGGTPQYCASQGNSVYYEWIDSFTLGGFTNNSGTASSGYSDHTDLIIPVSNGSAYPISISPGFSGNAYNEYYKVWIDFNNDMDFNDTGELVFAAGPTAATASGIITIPSNTYQGNTRMRVSIKYGGPPSACEIFSYGEVEDYTIELGGTPIVCDPPSGLSVINITETTATLDWTSVDEALDYNIRYRVLNSANWITISDIDQTSYNLTGLFPGVSYEVQVSSNCASNTNSAWSSSVEFTCLEEAICPIPNQLLSGNITEYTASLIWNEVSEANTYELRYRPADSPNWETITGIPSNSYELTNLESETVYLWEVRAICDQENSNWSETESFETTNGCNSPTDLQSFVLSPWEAELLWQTDTLHLFYQVQIKENTDSLWTLIDSIDSPPLFVDDLDQNTGYEWQVRGVCSNGYSPWSFADNFTTPVDSTCYLPETFQVSDVTFSAALISWSTANFAANYDLRYRPVNSPDWTTISAINSTSYQLTALEAETNYEVQLNVNCITGDFSGWSNAISFETAAISVPDGYCESYGLDSSNEWIDYFALSNVENVTGNDGGYLNYEDEIINLSEGQSYQMHFSKDGQNGLCYFSFFLDYNMNGIFESNERIYRTRKYFNSNYSVKINVPTNISSGFTKLRVVMKYYGYASACEIYDRGETEDYIVFLSSENNQSNGPDINEADDMEDLMSEKSDVQLFPNPASDLLNIQLIGFHNIKAIGIYGISGQLSTAVPIVEDNMTVPIDHLKPGIYYLSIQSDEGINTKKFIKI